MENAAERLESPRIIANWYTHKVSSLSFMVTGLLVVLILGLCLFDWSSASINLSASRELVFSQKQYWRLWSALFAHGDIGHLFGNLFLFVPFSLLLTGYFNFSLFPGLGFLIGGAINAIALQTMPLQTELLGISGLVNWMGSLWLTLFFLIDRRSSLRKRFAVVLFSSLVLFAPEAYKEDVSYVSHLIGYGLGILTGLIYYALHRKDFLAAEVKESVLEFDA
ncbi:rhomboid family intramembrane serine protease [Bdellovibrio sp. qaytius]|nr:rhomboid family intramembrane serine protease [Bdellovibrio sp. qaytius]